MTAATGTRVRVSQIRLPLQQRWRNATRTISHCSYTVLEIMDADVIAVAVVGGLVDAVATERLALEALSLEPDHPDAVWERLSAPPPTPGVRTLVDLAVWDRYARSAGVPVGGMFGGSVAQPAYASGGGYPQPGHDDAYDGLAQEAASWAESGWSAFKIKVGADNAEDARRIAAIRAGAPAMTILIDANGAWSRACDCLDLLDRVGGDIGWIEEPFVPNNLEAYAELANRTDILLAAGEQERGVAGLVGLMDHGGVRVLQPDATVLDGGATAWLHAAGLAAARGVTVSPHHWVEVHAQLLPAAPTATTLEYVQPGSIINYQRMFQVSARADQGWVTPPPGAGWGLALGPRRSRYRAAAARSPPARATECPHHAPYRQRNPRNPRRERVCHRAAPFRRNAPRSPTARRRKPTVTVRIAFLDRYTDAVTSLIHRHLPAEWTAALPAPTPDSLLAAVRDADAILTGWTPVDAHLIANAKRVRIIHKLGTGVDKIDVDACRDRGIAVARLAGANAVPVAEHVVLLILATMRRLPVFDRPTREGNWLKEHARGNESPAARQASRVGRSRTGRPGGSATAQRLRHRSCVLRRGCRSAAFERRCGLARLPMGELLTTSDIVSLQLPLTDSTRNLIDAEALSRMKDGAVLVNCGPGRIGGWSARSRTSARYCAVPPYRLRTRSPRRASSGEVTNRRSRRERPWKCLARRAAGTATPRTSVRRPAWWLQ